MTAGAIQVQPNFRSAFRFETVNVHVRRSIRTNKSMNLKSNWTIIVTTLFVRSQRAQQSGTIRRAVKLLTFCQRAFRFQNHPHITVVAEFLQLQTAPVTR